MKLKSFGMLATSIPVLQPLEDDPDQPGIRGGFTEKAYAKVDFKALLKEKGLAMHGLEVKLPGNKHHSILNPCSSGAVKAETAKMIADVLEMSATAIFRYETDVADVILKPAKAKLRVVGD